MQRVVTRGRSFTSIVYTISLSPEQHEISKQSENNDNGHQRYEEADKQKLTDDVTVFISDCEL